jgi:tape measure domain-containing protein
MAINWDALLNIRANVQGRQELKRLSKDLEGLQGTYRGLGRTIRTLAGTYFSLRVAQSAFRAGIARIESERRLDFLSRGYDSLAKVQEAAAESAERFGLSQTQANTQFAQIYGRLRPLGLKLEEIKVVFDGFNTAAKLSGTTASEASAAFLQLSQGLGTGVLRGEELNSVWEQTPAIVVAIADEMGVAVSRIRELAKQGLITNKVIIPALRSIATEGAGTLDEALAGPSQNIQDFRNQLEDLGVFITRELLPSITQALKNLTSAIKAFRPLLKGIIDVLGKRAALTGDWFNRLTNREMSGADLARLQIEGGRSPMNDAMTGGGFLGMHYRKGKVLRGNLADSGVSRLFEGTGPEGRGLEGILERADAELIRRSDAFFKENKRRMGKFQLARLDEQIVLKLMQDQLKLMDDAAKASEGLDKAQNGAAESVKKLAEAVRWQDHAWAKAAKGGLVEYQKGLENIAATISKSVVTIFKKLEDTLTEFVVTGTLNFKNFSQMIIREMARIAIQQTIMKPLTGWFTKLLSAKGNVFEGGQHLTAYAKGGVIDSPHYKYMADGGVAVAGEAGAEAILPLRRGRFGKLGVESSGSTGNNISINVDASGSTVEGDQGKGREFAEALSAAIQSELIHQQRPGGLLTT